MKPKKDALLGDRELFRSKDTKWDRGVAEEPKKTKSGPDEARYVGMKTCGHNGRDEGEVLTGKMRAY